MGGCCCKRGEGLYDACQRNDEAAALRLIEQQSSTGFKGQNEWTALHAAALHGNEAVVVALCRAGANVDVQDKDGWTPMHMAARRGHVDVVSQLLKYGAMLNVRNNQGKTVLDLVQQHHHSTTSVGKLKAYEEIADALTLAGAAAPYTSATAAARMK